MNRELTNLIDLLPIPKNPRFIPTTSEVNAVMTQLGVRFPKAYVQFITNYGSGRIDDFIWVLTPSTKCDDLKLQVRGVREAAATKEFIEKWSIASPYPIIPDASGVIPWAITDNGDLLFMHSHNDNWIGIFPRQSNNWQCFNKNILTFLYEVLSAKNRVECFPQDFPPTNHIYEPEG